MPRFLRFLLCLLLLAVLASGSAVAITSALGKHLLEPLTAPSPSPDFKLSLRRVNSAFEQLWNEAQVVPVGQADRYTIARRLSFALTGAPPSLEEVRRLEKLPPTEDFTLAWLSHLFSDQRTHHYLAERLARAFVGVEDGPFIVYRRRRLVNWLAEELKANQSYDQLCRSLIAADGVWTSNPATNFITVTHVPEGDNKGPDEIKLAARTSRAFLGISLDCMQCHDDKFGDRWKQEDFHQLASFFSQSEIGLTGIRDDRSLNYETSYRGGEEPVVVNPMVPYQPDLLPDEGDRRQKLARWITHPDNRPFARVAVNRMWALLFGRPLHDPVDDIPMEGPFPTGMEELATAFIDSDFDLSILIALIATSDPFQRDSRSDDPEAPVSSDQEDTWAAFPVTPLRPEQVAGAVIQSATLQALDADIHIFQKARRFGETRDFVGRFGDPEEDEFNEDARTIPQRLLLMNGKLVKERTEPNPVMNASTRLSRQGSNPHKAIEGAFLATLTRHPNEEEASHFVAGLDGLSPRQRDRYLEDLYWSLINTTEFSWNR